MKRLISIMAGMLMAISLCAQSSQHIVDIQTWKNITTAGTCTIFSTLVTDISTGSRSGFVTIRIGSDNYLDYNTILRDELDRAITVLEFANDNLIQTKPENSTQAVFVSSTDCRIGVTYSVDAMRRSWNPFVQIGVVDKRSMMSFKTSDMEELIKALKDCAATIDGFIAGN